MFDSFKNLICSEMEQKGIKLPENENELQLILNELFGVHEEDVKGPTRYPLTNISTDKNDILYIEIACAGFGKQDLQVELNDDVIVITGTYPQDAVETEFTYYQQNISARDFVRKIAIGHTYDTNEIVVDYEDGLLLIIVPEKEVQKPSNRVITF